ncbi:membrane protein insertase YidC [Solimonas marina]|uniref:Membrane protein insertase YidC n=1 Tax=Solimonas marina TaxID=2714601 RepID=A0A969W5Q9_9GAMM|nr:membrane protein insertase YidC [Solimonas marina]NKF21146.1 membrane protein insertase YidC [Solimonas marina]
MENRRFILIALTGVVLFFLYQAWQKDYGNRPPETPVAETAQAPQGNAAAAAASVADTGKPNPADASAPAATATAQTITVDTDVYVAEISTQGGEIKRLELKHYPATKDKAEPMSLLDDRNGRLFVLQSGLVDLQQPLTSDQTIYSAAQTSYQLAQGQDQLDVTLTYEGADGLQAQKVYHFHRDSYEIELSQTLKNGDAERTVSPYVRLVRTDYKPDGEPRFSHTFTGVGFYQQSEPGSDSYKFKKTALDKLDKDAFETHQTGGWITILQHYFVAAIIPDQKEALTYSAKPREGGGYKAQMVGAGIKLAPGETHAFDTKLYIGPKLQDRIEDVAPRFDLTLDYGILTPIAKPLFIVLKFFHKLTGNWGFAIILLTISVKLALYKLSEAQYRSMAKMKVFGPKIQDLRERYADDRERLQKAMMDLYKKEGFNPLAGCWPMLVQFPIFISLYWVLLESVELRQAPFMLWLQDLSAPDPFYVLPVLYGATMWLQQKLSGNQTMDPTQQKMMQMMPIFLTAFFTFFQSGLVLYWVVNGMISIAQQWYITRKFAPAPTTATAKR